MEYQVLLFDLDGTLTASGEGITKCVQYALEKMNKRELAKIYSAISQGKVSQKAALEEIDILHKLYRKPCKNMIQ